MYRGYFGIQQTPFSVTPDPRFFYANSHYQEAFAALLYGIKARKGFIVVTGEVGTGKTTLLRKVMRNLDATIQSVYIFNTYLQFPELLQLILHDLGLADKGQSQPLMLQELNEYLIQQLKKRQTVSLLIDEAQNLDEEALEGLRLLSNLETDNEKLLQIVLIGQPELDTSLNKPSLRQLKQRIAIRCCLQPLTRPETGKYILHRLQVSGYHGPEIFSKHAVESIWSYSRGIPRLINILCDNALVTAFAGSRKRVSADMVVEVARDLHLDPDAQKPKVKSKQQPLEDQPKVQTQTLEPATRKVIRSREEAFRLLQPTPLQPTLPEKPTVQVPKVRPPGSKVPSRDETLQVFTDEALQAMDDLGSRRLGRVVVRIFLLVLLLAGIASVTIHHKERLRGLGLNFDHLLGIAGKYLQPVDNDAARESGRRPANRVEPAKTITDSNSELFAEPVSNFQSRHTLNANDRTPKKRNRRIETKPEKFFV